MLFPIGHSVALLWIQTSLSLKKKKQNKQNKQKKNKTKQNKKQKTKKKKPLKLFSIIVEEFGAYNFALNSHLLFLKAYFWDIYLWVTLSDFNVKQNKTKQTNKQNKQTIKKT